MFFSFSSGEAGLPEITLQLVFEPFSLALLPFPASSRLPAIITFSLQSEDMNTHSIHTSEDSVGIQRLREVIGGVVSHCPVGQFKCSI